MNTITTRSTVILAVTDADEVLAPAGYRQPDMFDEGMAYWMGANGVASLPLERVGDLAEIMSAARFVDFTTEKSTGWVRVAPSQYGVEVDCYGSDPSAEAAWTVLAEAVQA